MRSAHDLLRRLVTLFANQQPERAPFEVHRLAPVRIVVPHTERDMRAGARDHGIDIR